MLQPIRSLCVFLCVSSIFLLSDAQFFDTGASSLGSAPVGFIDRFEEYGERENIASLGMAPVGVYQRRQYPFQAYYPRIPLVEAYPLVRPACQLPGPCPEPMVLPVRPPVKPICQFPGSCRDQVLRPARLPLVRPRPPVKSACLLPGPCPGRVVKPVRPAVRPAVKPKTGRPKKPKKTMRPKKPMAKTQEPKLGDVGGRNAGLGSLLAPVLGLLGNLGGK